MKAVVTGGAGFIGSLVVERLIYDGYDVVVNKPKSAAYRAPGSPQAAFAAETVSDELARIHNMDPIDFRLQNASKEDT